MRNHCDQWLREEHRIVVLVRETIANEQVDGLAGTNTYTHTHTHTYTHSNAHTHTHTHTVTHARTHTQTDKQTNKNTHMYTDETLYVSERRVR